MIILSIEVTFDYMSIPPQDMWQILRTTHVALLPDEKKIDLYGDLHKAGNMQQAIEKKKKPHFLAKFPEGELGYAPIGTPRLNQLFIKGCINNLEDAWIWVKPLLLLKEFRTARIFDHEYEFWQNAEDPIQYENSGKDYAGLPMKSNGLPFPLEQQVVDTSGNPGRRIFRNGFVEAIGAIMWLGDQFWKLTGAKRQDVLTADWLVCEELPNNVLHVQAFKQPFTTAESEQGKIQDRLRALLFPEAEK